MLAVPGLQDHGHDAGAHVGVLILAGMVDADDVGAGLRHHLQQLDQAAGLVDDLGGDFGDATGLGQALGDDAGQGGDIHVAAGHHAHGLLGRGIHLAEHAGGHGGGAGALGDGLLALHQSQDGGGDLVFGDGDDLVHVLLAQLEGQLAGSQDVDAVGDGVAVGHGGDLAGSAGLIHGGHGAGLDADDLAVGLQALDGEGDAADQAAAADGADHLLHVGELLQNLQADGALAGNDVGVVEGMGEGVAVELGQAVGLPGSVVIHAGDQDHFRAVALGGLHLADGGAGGHADDGLDAQLGGGQGDALGVVAGGAGDDTALGLIGGQRTDLVVSAADLEGTGQLQVLSLDVQIVRDLGCGIQRRPAGDTPEGGLGVLDHFQCQHDKDLPNKILFQLFEQFSPACPPEVS